MRVNLFETSVNGHRARYLREIIVGLKHHNNDRDVRLCTFEENRVSPEYLEYLKPIEDLFRFCPLPCRRMVGSFRSELTRLGLLRECIEQEPCDRLIIPYGDGLIPLMGILPRWFLRGYVPESIQLESMLFRAEWVYESQRPTQWLYHQLRRWAVGRWPGWRLHYSDFNAWDRAQSSVDRYQHAEVSLVPEVFNQWELRSKSEAIGWLKSEGYLSDRSTPFDSHRAVISLPCLPSRRKGAVELIAAFVEDKKLEGSLLLWATIPKNVQEILARRGVQWKDDPRILIVEKYVDDDAFEALFSLADLIVLPYQFHLGGVSSLYLLSVIHRKSTLCDQRAWMGWAVERYQHGKAIDCRDPKRIHQELSSWLSGGEIRTASHQTAEQLRSECTPERFGSMWARP